MRLEGHYDIHAGHTNNKYYNTYKWRAACCLPQLDNATHCYTRRPDDSFASLKKFYRRHGNGPPRSLCSKRACFSIMSFCTDRKRRSEETGLDATRRFYLKNRQRWRFPKSPTRRRSFSRLLISRCSSKIKCKNKLRRYRLNWMHVY
jgi:hypothetical protein